MSIPVMRGLSLSIACSHAAALLIKLDGWANRSAGGARG